MAALTDLTIAQLTTALAKKEASAVDVADAHLKKLDEHRALNAFITETPDKARDMAKASDARRAKGEAGSCGRKIPQSSAGKPVVRDPWTARLDRG